jgi:hypothetical protein
MGAPRPLKEKSAAIVGLMEDLVASESKAKALNKILLRTREYNMEAKERLLEDKERTIFAKERHLEAKESLLKRMAKNEVYTTKELNRMEAELDFLRGLLKRRFLLDKYESDYMNDLQGSRLCMWKSQISRNEKLRAFLEKIGQDEDWPNTIVQLYETLSMPSEKLQCVLMGFGTPVVIVDDEISNLELHLLRFLANELYLGCVKVLPRTYVLGLFGGELEE